MNKFHILTVLLVIAAGWAMSTAVREWVRTRRFGVREGSYALLVIGGALLAADTMGRARSAEYVPVTWFGMTGTFLGLVATILLAVDAIRSRRRAGS